MQLSQDELEYSQFEIKLRDKWCEVPVNRMERVFSRTMLTWSNTKLLEYWEEGRFQTSTPEVRGWFQELYKNELTGKQVADIGPGIGVDGIFFAQHGAQITFVDIVKDNLLLIERICSLKGIDADFYFVDNFFNFNFAKIFDVFMAIGSFINAPIDFMKREINAMSPFLRHKGKVIMLGYPKERYISLGAQSCEHFAKMTDGERTPWVEWYDDDKVKTLFGSNYVLNWSKNFGEKNIEFNWFDLTKISHSGEKLPDINA